MEAALVNGYAIVDSNVGDELTISYFAVPILEDRRFKPIATPTESTKIDGCVLRYGPKVLAIKEEGDPKIEDLRVKIDENGVLQLPESLANAYDMSNDERNGKYTFVFNVTFEK